MVLDTVFHCSLTVPDFAEGLAEDRQTGIEMARFFCGRTVLAETDDRQYVIIFQKCVWSLA